MMACFKFLFYHIIREKSAWYKDSFVWRSFRERVSITDCQLAIVETVESFPSNAGIGPDLKGF